MSSRRRLHPGQNMKVPTVRIVRTAGRPFQLRYTCPTTKREIRISTGTRDEITAENLRTELQAQLVLGIPSHSLDPMPLGPEMAWETFREHYRRMHLDTIRKTSAIHVESRLDLAERILRPRTLADMANPSTLHLLQSQLLSGAKSRRKKPRSPHTVRGHMNTILAALNWASLQQWLTTPPRIRKLKVSKLKVMKGRPITETEFEIYLKAVPSIVGNNAAESWIYLIRGLWESALRLTELMHVSWDHPRSIRPIWKEGGYPILQIPAHLQKNDTEEEIPLLPDFERLLFETPPEERRGWVFNPHSLQGKLGRPVRFSRPNPDWVGKILAKIGKASGIIVDPADLRTGRPDKYVTAHDLRRSCGERLREAGVPPLVICRVMRHSSWETTRRHYAPGDIQKDASVLFRVLKTPNDQED